MPLQATRRAPSSNQLNDELAFAASARLQIFVSRAAVAAAVQVAANAVASAQVRIAVGRTTAAALYKCGLQCETAQSGAEDSDGVLDLPILQQVRQQNVVIWAAPGGRQRIAQVLTERGAAVRVAHIYQRLPLRPRHSALRQVRIQKDCVCLSATSNALLLALDRCLRCAALNELRGRPIIVASPRIAALASQLGYTHVHIANGASSAALIAAFRSIG